MIFSSKTPKTKEERIAANKDRDARVRRHLAHMAMSAKMREVADQSTAPQDSPDPDDGIDEDFRSKVGRKKQQAKEAIHAMSHRRKMGGMRRRIRKSRARNRNKGRTLGF